MINRATADLESATMRTRFFGGRRAEEIAACMPMLPVDAPGMPSVGPSLAVFAKVMGDEDPPQVIPGGRKKPRPGRPCGPQLTAFIRSALYQPGTALALAHSGQVISVSMLSGVTQDAHGLHHGPSRCRLVVVGKCVGKAEVERQQPFCGPGSDPLWKAWHEAGLPLPGPSLPTFMTNILRFDPPPAVMAKLPPAWVMDGVHMLYQELAICRPEFVLVLGADALKAVFGAKARVGDYKGRVVDLEIDCRPGPDTPDDKFTCRVVTADHPAGISRDPDKYPQLLNSMHFLARHLGMGPRGEASVITDYQAVLTVDDLRVAVAESEKASAGGGYISFDCEWEGTHPTEPGAYLYTVQWSHAPGHARVVFLRRCGGAENQAMELKKALPLLKRLFEGATARGARLVAHFGKADLPWLRSIGVDLYPHYVGPRNDPDPDGSADRLWAWQKSYFEGAFDTYIAAHAVDESQPLGLEMLTTTHVGMDRYDVDLMNWRKEYLAEHKLAASKLKGFGNFPESRMLHYAAGDCDGTGRLYLVLNGDPAKGTKGQLDEDRFKNSSRQIFSTRMRAWAAISEMEYYGMEVDRDQHRRQRDAIATAREERLDQLRGDLNWPDFTPSKRAHRVELLFGEAYSKDSKPVRPSGAVSFYLEPYKSTDASSSKLWAEALRRHELGGPKPSPAADKETLICLMRNNKEVGPLLDIDFLSTAMKIIFRQPDAPSKAEEGEEEDASAGGDEKHSQGLLAELDHDGRVRTRFGHVETGRYSSSRPNLQNLSGEGIDEKYERILKWGPFAPEGSPNALRRFVTRAVLCARPGWYLVTADLKGAEVAAAGWFSGDATLMAHAARATLDADDPDYLDLHADLANTTFKLGLTLKEVKKKHKPLRTAAKKTRFSHYYGASVDTIYRQVLQETPDVTVDQISALVDGHDRMYPGLTKFFSECRKRPGGRGWLCNGYGGYRRFRPAVDRDLQGDQEREAQNWIAQGLVADNIANSLGNLWYNLRADRMQSRIVLTVHDSIVCECPPEEVEIVATKYLPEAMSEQSPVVITNLDGIPLPRGPYYFGVDVSVYHNWGIELSDEEWKTSPTASTTA